MGEFLIPILIFFVGASLVFYVVFGGADFGAGVLEWLAPKKIKSRQREVINRAMGPVWEANHMWLIILVVILFMGFPKAFGVIVVSLHFPLVALLVGIVLRGCAFTFRHYDAIKSEASQNLYSFFFSLSSVWTSLWLGIIASSLSRGYLSVNNRTPYDVFLKPWWGAFPILMGFFTLTIFTFLAAVYLIGETSDSELKQYFQKKALILNIAVVLIGGLLFLTSIYEPQNFLMDFLEDNLSLACLIGATGLFLFLWKAIGTYSPWVLRVVAAGQVSLILFGWFSVHWPHLVETQEGPVSFYEAAAPQATLEQLVLALVVGSLLIFPSLFFLLKVFKTEDN